MHIAYDAAPLVTKQRSAVGIAQAEAVLSLSRSHEADRFSLLYFSLRSPKKKRGHLAPYLRENVQLSPCGFYSGRLYRTLYGILPLPFSMFFKKRADVTHFFDFLIPPGVKGKCVVSVPDTSYLHDPTFISRSKRLFLKWNMRRSLSRADRIITHSESMKRELMEYYGIREEKLRVIAHSVDTQRFHANLEGAKIAHVRERYHLPERYLLYMGAIEPRKNLSRLVDAYAQLVTKMGRDLPVLVVAGRGGFRHELLRRKVERLGLSDRIRFCGYVAERDKPYLLCGAECFLFVSLMEGFGLPVLEAMSCGVPVLTSAIPAMEEVCGGAALLCDPTSTASIKEGLWTLLNNESLRGEYARKGFERAGLEQFSRTYTCEQLYNVYRELVED